VEPNECPANPEAVAESYIMGTLRKEQVIAFEDHYAACEARATLLYKTADYVDAMRAGAKKLRSESTT
jgi:hypothetical protein